ncbi:MAG: hypothetical protein CMN32_07100 [Saprospirales bacterium]|nr:hypothetical protein [Saprospirales bacterium]
MFLTIFISCQGQDNSQTATTKKAEQDNNPIAELSKQKACDAIPLATIASLMDVDKSTINQEDMSFGEKRSICYYYTKEGNRKFFIRMAWKSEKAQGNQVLQNQYAKYLSSGENDIKEYQELKNTGDTQILFGIGQDRENKYIHILRKRFGNKAEVQLELTKENKDEMAKDQLIEVLKELN